MAYSHSNSAKIKFLDGVYPPTGTIGYLALLDSRLLGNALFSANASTDTLIFTVPNKLVTGSRIRVTSTTTLPGGLLSNTDYYAIGFSTTEIQLASSLANAIAGTQVNLTDAGSGTLAAFEQDLTDGDSLDALVAHELVSTAYTQRFEVTNVGPSTIVAGDAQKAPWIQLFTNNSTDTIVSGYRLLIYDGSSNIRSANGNGFSLDQEQVTIYSGDTKSFAITFMRRT